MADREDQIYHDRERRRLSKDQPRLYLSLITGIKTLMCANLWLQKNSITHQRLVGFAFGCDVAMLTTGTDKWTNAYDTFVTDSHKLAVVSFDIAARVANLSTLIVLEISS
jgi:hypothetical protein